MRAFDYASGRVIDYEPLPQSRSFVVIREFHTLPDGTPQGLAKDVLVPLDEFVSETSQGRRQTETW